MVVKVVALVLKQAPCHEEVWGIGGIAAHILNWGGFRPGLSAMVKRKKFLILSPPGI
jgi:hypothetical protein